MAEGGAKGIGKVLQRTVTRTKEKVLQNLGRADKTKDDEFEQHVTNFQEQQTGIMKLQKELKHYSSCLKELSHANLSMHRVMKELYETTWIGYTEFCAAHEELSSTWDNYLVAVNEQVISPLNNYASLFPEFKNKINKRNRKLMDFDGARHNHESVSNAKKLDDNKVAKAVEELNEAKQIYESINSNLIEELPSFYNSRLHALSYAFNNFILSEMFFHSVSIEVKNHMATSVKKLKDDSEKFRVTTLTDLPTTPIKRKSIEGDQREADDQSSAHIFSAQKLCINVDNNSSNNEGDAIPEHPASQPEVQGSLSHDGNTQNLCKKPAPFPVVPAPTYQNAKAVKHQENGAENSQDEFLATDKNAGIVSEGNDDHSMKEKKTIVAEINPDQISSDDDDDHDEKDSIIELKESTIPEVVANVSSVSNYNQDVLNSRTPSDVKTNAHDIPVAKHPNVVPVDRVLFRVRTTHSYVGEDTDELTFEIGEIITVVPFDDPDEQDDGWLMGVKETTRERGVFPENFTTHIE